MGRYIHELISLIMELQLHFRFSRWKEDLFLLEQGFYSDEYCRDVLIQEARQDADRIRDQGNFLWRPPTKEELYADGKPDIELGSLVEADPVLSFGIRFRDRPRNCLLLGGAGSGKSTLGRQICMGIDAVNQQFPEYLSRLVIIDPKPDYVGLRSEFKGKTSVFSPHYNLRCGLNGPPDVPPLVWVNYMTLSLAGRLGLIMARTCLAAIIVRLLLALNTDVSMADLQDPTVSQELTWPPLRMVLDVARNNELLDMFSSKADYRNSLIQALDGLLYDSGSLFDCCNGLDLVSTLRTSPYCIFNVSNTTPCITGLIMDIVIYQLLVRKMHLNYKCDRTEEVFLIDEYDIIQESDNSKMGSLGMLNRFGREMGLMSVTCISGVQND